jgi:hypothetical protein
VNTYLVYLNSAQKVDTVEHGTIRGLVVANPEECQTRALARDYLSIEAGDEIIACTADGIRWKAAIDEIVDATREQSDEDASADGGGPVRVLQGKLVARGSRSIAAVCKQMRDNDIELPAIINSRGSGFKQGALATLLTDEQNEQFSTGLS